MVFWSPNLSLCSCCLAIDRSSQRLHSRLPANHTINNINTWFKLLVVLYINILVKCNIVLMKCWYILRSFRQPFNKVSVRTVHTQSISITMYRSVDHYYYVLWSPHRIRKSITLLPSYDFPFGRYFHYIIITSCSVIINSQNTIIARVHDIVITSRCVYNKSVYTI